MHFTMIKSNSSSLRLFCVLCFVFWDSIKGLCQESVHREGVNPSSMDGVPDLRDHNRFLVF